MPHTPDDFSREEASLARHRSALRERFALLELPARAPHRRVPMVVACVATLLGALLWADPAFHTQRYATAAGERQHLTLADGTELTLNTRTVAEVEWHLRTRQVRLVDGEAFFDVAHAAWRPFLVRAGDTTVRVVGTILNVRRADPRVMVTVLRGRVHVEDASGDAMLLSARQAVESVGGMLTARAAPDPAAAVAWKDGKLMFERTPLVQVLADINRYRAAPATLADPALERLQISGVFDSARTDALLDLLPSILPVTIRRETDDTVRIFARSVAR
ncbi:FecR family protein [Ralstonia sp. UBA689]|uniref:FecR family protein n=1 Tax=Ralstonia sp. UBA689 TaxID=1947373 RepID=UPI0025D04756|nr:FecR domain-containing protein [Ralstonia sp. UBA689]